MKTCAWTFCTMNLNQRSHEERRAIDGARKQRLAAVKTPTDAVCYREEFGVRSGDHKNVYGVRRAVMAIPDNRNDLESLGYVFLNRSHCSGCGAAIEWWTTPNKKRMPFFVTPEDVLLPHWANCPKAGQFRRKP